MFAPAVVILAGRVALLAEGVDRNSVTLKYFASLSSVALLAEGVDRNSLSDLFEVVVEKSPSSRRAWIEISGRSAHWLALTTVALLAEGVDRNISAVEHLEDLDAVALLAEGVDRNLKPLKSKVQVLRRPPRGGRG